MDDCLIYFVWSAKITITITILRCYFHINHSAWLCHVHVCTFAPKTTHRNKLEWPLSLCCGDRLMGNNWATCIFLLTSVGNTVRSKQKTEWLWLCDDEVLLTYNKLFVARPVLHSQWRIKWLWVSYTALNRWIICNTNYIKTTNWWMENDGDDDSVSNIVRSLSGGWSSQIVNLCRFTLFMNRIQLCRFNSHAQTH